MKRWLVLGGSGTLGRALTGELQRRGDEALSAARRGADIALDLREPDALGRVLDEVQPDAVINSAAIINLGLCEAEPEMAQAVNAAPAKTLANWSQAARRPFIQISTDHFFDGDGQDLHDEEAPVTLLNEYARSKHAGEQFALGAPGALVIRTNVTGINYGREPASFALWAANAIRGRQRLTLFEDFFTSTIDAGSLAAAVLDLAGRNAHGLLNVASSEASSKWEFVHALAAAMGVVLDWAQRGSAASLEPRRAMSLGLDVSRAEALLGRPLPDLLEVCEALADSLEGPTQQWAGTNISPSGTGTSGADARPISSPTSLLRMMGNWRARSA